LGEAKINHHHHHHCRLSLNAIHTIASSKLPTHPFALKLFAILQLIDHLVPRFFGEAATGSFRIPIRGNKSEIRRNLISTDDGLYFADEYCVARRHSTFFRASNFALARPLRPSVCRKSFLSSSGSAERLLLRDRNRSSAADLASLTSHSSASTARG